MRRFVAFMVLLVIGAFLNAPPAGANSDFCFMNNVSSNTALDAACGVGASMQTMYIDTGPGIAAANAIIDFDVISTINRLRAGKDAADVGVHPGDRYAVEMNYQYMISGTTANDRTTSGAASHFDHGTIMRC